MPMTCPSRIAVLDWMGGRLVHAVAGKRGCYQDLGQRFPHLAGRSPSELLRTARRDLGIDQVYVADLDRLRAEPGAPLASGAAAVDLKFHWSDSVAEWLADGWTVWGDLGRAGLCPGRGETLAAVAAHLRWRPIVGTESFDSPSALLAAVRAQEEPGRWTVSLDLVGTERLAWFAHGAEVLPWAANGLEGQPGHRGRLGEQWQATWEGVSLEALVSELVLCGVRRLVVLNLSDVGTGIYRSGGVLGQLRRSFPQVELVTGGGVRDWDTVRQLGSWGANHVLMGTWLWEQLQTVGASPLYRPIQTC